MKLNTIFPLLIILLSKIGQSLSNRLTLDFEIPLPVTVDAICPTLLTYALIALKGTGCLMYKVEENKNNYYMTYAIDLGHLDIWSSCTTSSLHMALAVGSKVKTFDWIPPENGIEDVPVGGTGSIYTYPLPEGTGIRYGPTDAVDTSIFFLVAMFTNPDPSGYKAYKIPFIPGMTPNLEFNLATRPIDLSFKNGTFHFIVTYDGDKREIFDSTNPTLSSVHNKLHGSTLMEFSLTTTSKNRDYYISSLIGLLEVVRFTQTTIKNGIILTGSPVSQVLTKIIAIPNSDLIALLDGSKDKIAILNFLSQTQEFEVLEFADGG